MLFKKKEKPPLQQAARMVYDAIEIACQYKRDKGFMPTADDLKLFAILEHALSEASGTASYLARCMNQRAAGELEGAKKYTDQEVHNYHYPSN